VLPDARALAAAEFETMGVGFTRYVAHLRGGKLDRTEEAWMRIIAQALATPPASDAAVPAGQTFEVDDRGLFCRHCGRSSVRHHRVIGVGNFCDPAAAPKVASDTEAGEPQ
jgi:hypothetical protein